MAQAQQEGEIFNILPPNKRKMSDTLLCLLLSRPNYSMELFTQVHLYPSLVTHLILGDGPGCEEGKPTAVQVPCQILPRGCVRGVNPGCHAAAVLPAGEGGNLK